MIIASRFHLADRAHRLVVTYCVSKEERWKEIEKYFYHTYKLISPNIHPPI